MRRFILPLFALGLLPAAVLADCASDDEIAAFVGSARAKTPAAALVPNGSMADALCTQGKLAQALEPAMGPIIGYKAGLTSAAAQERFGATEPVRGLLFEKMMVEDGASVPLQFGAVPVVEADLVLVVGDATINDASSPAEVMAYVSAVHPFIELADLALAKGEPLTAVTLTAMAVSPKLGVLGAAIPVEDAVTMANALEAMTVTLTNGDGDVVASAPGAAVLDHPANAVLWLVANGVTLQKGDLVSVGSFGPLTPAAQMRGGARVTYTGLPGDPSVSVYFVD
tara:strand:+ start:152068 stop:152916 length:849 start_codon:yes stop_codon:yes gene_type:complete